MRQGIFKNEGSQRGTYHLGTSLFTFIVKWMPSTEFYYTAIIKKTHTLESFVRSYKETLAKITSDFLGIIHFVNGYGVFQHLPVKDTST